jgi:alpha-tubulin suppressor-like RCC1 family protein
MKFLKHYLLLVALVTSAIGAEAATPFPMSTGDYSENFSTIASWTNNFTGPSAATYWSSVPVNASGAIPNGQTTTIATTNFVTGSSSGVQKGLQANETIMLLAGGDTNNTSACAIDLSLDFTGRVAGSLSFFFAPVDNDTGDRVSSLQVYTSVNGINWTPIGTTWNLTNNSGVGAGLANFALPASFHNSATARIRFYVYNGAGGTTGSRPKISIDDVLVTSTVPPPLVVSTLAATALSNATATLNGTVDPAGLSTTTWFEWGTASFNYAQQTTPIALGSGSTTLIVSNTLSGLTPGIIYHCRLVASNTFGLSRGSDVSFGSPSVTLNGAGMFTNECHAFYTDAGATVFNAPLAVAAGASFSLGLRADGRVSGWGINNFSQINVPANVSNIVAIGAGFFHGLALRTGGTVVAWNNNSFGQTNIPGTVSNVIAIAAGSYHNLALRSDGKVIAWGSNSSGQTNVPVSASNVVAIAAGSEHNLVLRTDGTIVAWGLNNLGQTILPASATNIVAIAAGFWHSLALRGDGKVISWGGVTNVPANVSNVVAIAAGRFFNLALQSNGTVIAWGTNDLGQLNIPASVSNVVAIAAGHYHSLALRVDGAVIGWGQNSSGEINVPASLNILNLVTNGLIDTNVPGIYPRTYTSVNFFGGTTSATRTVVVNDTLPPAITLLGNSPIVITNQSNLPLVDPGATALDLCGGSFSVIASNNVNPNFPGVYAITYRATDSFGNTGIAARPVIIALPAAVPGDQNGDGIVSQSELETVYSSYVTNSPWLQMTNVAGLGASNITFSLSNSVLGAYSVEYSTNLANWFHLGAATPRYLFTDTNAATIPQRYYRLRYP